MKRREQSPFDAHYTIIILPTNPGLVKWILHKTSGLFPVILIGSPTAGEGGDSQSACRLKNPKLGFSAHFGGGAAQELLPGEKLSKIGTSKPIFD
jgi:hypothetical protein